MPSKQLAEALKIIAELDPEELTAAIDSLDYEEGEGEDMESEMPEMPDLADMDYAEEDMAPEDDEGEDNPGVSPKADLPPAKYKKKKD